MPKFLYGWIKVERLNDLQRHHDPLRNFIHFRWTTVFPRSEDRASHAYDCRMIDPALISSAHPARFTAHGAV
jgi:hypothetical protein